ncbi:MacB family efflux pump subunit [Nisaea acidiphila]|uniref:Pyoverdine export ATP-binding/permease protein PvdT n=1 Tax=Nisaea acidiphila TaxID=1862145 RepID=A0A9J7B1P8_9PROT|nr:MacB family efflux pump subunit [Nisaea acidiphila]UUX51589.1 MacB family efflux pump subunit [Nisaea acidiphila]
MSSPLIRLESVRREFPSGEGTIAALKSVDLSIERGEMVAIIGASGSGKSTLMNILGCLDRPTSGTYRISGTATGALGPDDLAALRRTHFGFIFQRYNLLAELTAAGNVEMPAIYAGQSNAERREKAAALLTRLGMADRAGHRPGQLSGGQQQRVSIARALINDADVILADEPTGALDSKSSAEVLSILHELHREGRTVIIVTHDPEVAAQAERIVELSDGEIVSDRQTVETSESVAAPDFAPSFSQPGWRAGIDRFFEAFAMALLAMRAHKLRTLLTMLGIVIGIASVVCVLALGQGSSERVLSDIRRLGTNTLEIFPGKSFGDVRSGRIETLVAADADALARRDFVAAVTPTVATSKTTRHGAIEATSQVNGVGAQYFAAKATELAEGSLFGLESIRRMEQVVVIDVNTRATLFPDDPGAAIGSVIFVGQVPCRVIGVVEARQSGFGGSQNLTLYLPYTTVQARILGSPTLRSIILRVTDETDMEIAKQAVTDLLKARHGTEDFFILNTDEIRKTITSTTRTMTLLISAIALISLAVGGIGVMNIMLVSVSERIGEIGVRMAVGARRGDILQQFLIEAVLVCLLSGVLGILAALAFGLIFSLLNSSFPLIYSVSAMGAAVLCASMIGIVFGYLPARNASRLDPSVVLSGN